MNLGVDLIMKTLLEKGFDPQTEYAADLTGRQLAMTTGYAPGGLRAVLIRLQGTSAGRQQPFSTHPPLTERLKRLPADSSPAPATNPAAKTPGTTRPAVTADDEAAAQAPGDVDDDDRAFAEEADKQAKKKK
jgi:predicted Zn-dependent protease